MAKSQLFYAKQVLTGTEVVSPGAVWAVDGVIQRVGSDWRNWDLPEDTEKQEYPDSYLTPGYIDIHHHGAAGAAYDEGYEAAKIAVAAHQKHGTMRCVISYVTGSIEQMVQRVQTGARLVREDPRVLGLHLEGPFLDPGHKGAHPEHHLCDPTPDRVSSLLDAAQDTIIQVTLAPERDHALAAIKQFAQAGVITAVGHCNADFQVAQQAFTAGARILTHAFNAMNPIHHRQPGPIIAALRDPQVWLEVINDGIHVHPAVIRSLFLEAGSRMVLVTDAMSATCQADGQYLLGELPVYVKDGVARLCEGDNLAGSTLTMDQAVVNTVKHVGVSLEQAIAAATYQPACAIGLGDKYGRLAPGYPADLLVLNPDTLLPDQVIFAEA